MTREGRHERLLVCDLDGTLADTCDVDWDCYCAAAERCLGVDRKYLRWAGAPHATDSGILHWLWRRHVGRAPTCDEASVFLTEFVRELRSALEINPGRFSAVPGVHAMITFMSKSGWDVAIATGGWRQSALLKLAAIGVSDTLLLSTCDDSEVRTQIFALAASRVIKQSSGPPSSRVVLIADGPWDAEVARSLQWPMVGIGAGDAADRLRSAGVEAIAEDFLDLELFAALAAGCDVP